ncbi:MAG: hypothetical protein FJW86_13600 [Actinobacteria bacterium]|nr:hypothetical protein [Actinomycetota bacterium]
MNTGKRHPIRGFFAGLFMGLAVAQFFVVFKVVALSTITPWIVVVVLTILGVVWALFGPTRARKGASASA